MDSDAAQDWEPPPEPATVETPDPTAEGETPAPDAEQPAETGGTAETPAEAPKTIEEERAELEAQRKALAAQAFEVRKLRKELKQKKESTPDEITLNDAQFEALLAEHQGDAKMQVQIMKQMARQIAKGEKVDAVKTVQQQQLRQKQAEFLSSNFPDLAQDDSPFRLEVEQAKGLLGLDDDNPDADWYATASVVMAKIPQLIKMAQEQGRQEALKGKTESARKASIRGQQMPAGTARPAVSKDEPSASNNYGLTSQQMETAKNNFGFTRPEQFKWYAQNLKATAPQGARA
jgi:hypothetical protein